MNRDDGLKRGAMDALRKETGLGRALLTHRKKTGRTPSGEARRRRTLRWAFGGFTPAVATVCVFAAVQVMGMGGESKPGQDSVWLVEDGWKFCSNAEYILAEKRFAKAVELNSGLPEAWSGLGWSRLREGVRQRGARCIRAGRRTRFARSAR